MNKIRDIKITVVKFSEGVPGWKELTKLLEADYKIIDKTIYNLEDIAVYVLEKLLTTK